MAYEHKEGQGSLFKNEKQNDRQPDYKGTILIQGMTYEIVGWERTSQRGLSFISLKASIPQDRGDQAQRQRHQDAVPTREDYHVSLSQDDSELEDLPF